VKRLVAGANRSRGSYGYGCSKPDSIGQWLPAGPLPTWPNPQRFCRDALNRNRGRRNAHRDSPLAHLSEDRSFSRTFGVGILLHDFVHTNVPLKRMRVSKHGAARFPTASGLFRSEDSFKKLLTRYCANEQQNINPRTDETRDLCLGFAAIPIPKPRVTVSTTQRSNPKSTA
jgi:hypothetical protein